MGEGVFVKGPAMADNIKYHDLPDENEFYEVDDPEEEEEEGGDPDTQDPGEDSDTSEPGSDVPEAPPVVPLVVEPIPIIPPFFMPNSHPWGNGTEITPTSTAKTTTATATPTRRSGTIADFSKDKKPDCYNSGYKAKRALLVNVIDDLCLRVGTELEKAQADRIANAQMTSLGPGLYISDGKPKDPKGKYIDYVTFFEIKEGCSWDHYSRHECDLDFKKIVDGCNTGGQNGKQGGTMEGNCIKWRVIQIQGSRIE
jgi:hypothetical protein